MPEEEAGTSFTGGSDLVVFKDSENRDTAWKFVDYLTQDPQQQKLYELVGSLPAVQSTWESGKLASDPLLQAFGAQLEDAKSAPAVATWEEVAAPLDDAIEQVSLGESSAEEALASAEQKANNIGFGS
jgi:multiple sugar transport system substrate-binding protein